MKQVTLEERDFKRIFKTQTPWGKFTKLAWRTTKQLFALGVLYIIFFVALNYSAYIKRFEYTVSPPTVVNVQSTPAPTPSQPAPNYSPELKISKIGLDAPIVMNIGINDVISNLANGVVQLAGSATPDQVGNVVIFGHSSDYPWAAGHYKNIFALLDKLSTGDQIAIPYQSQVFIYTVTGSKVVSPSSINVVAKTDTPTLTLITCYPVGTATNRLIVTATLTSGNTSGTQAGNPPSANLPTPR